MKIYSELTKEFYESVPECEKAEKAYEKEQKKLAEEKEIAEANKSKEKKELAKAIEEADKKLVEANELYEVAKKQAAELIEKSNKEVSEILDKAEKTVTEAEVTKFNAIKAFNDKFGAYVTTISDEKAANEFNRSVERFNNTLKSFLRNFWL